jgi:hypothetical protein
MTPPIGTALGGQMFRDVVMAEITREVYRLKLAGGRGGAGNHVPEDATSGRPVKGGCFKLRSRPPRSRQHDHAPGPGNHVG